MVSPCMLIIEFYCVVSMTIGDQSVRTLIKTLAIKQTRLISIVSKPIKVGVVVVVIAVVVFAKKN